MQFIRRVSNGVRPERRDDDPRDGRRQRCSALDRRGTSSHASQRTGGPRDSRCAGRSRFDRCRVLCGVRRLGTPRPRRTHDALARGPLASTHRSLRVQRPPASMSPRRGVVARTLPELVQYGQRQRGQPLPHAHRSQGESSRNLPGLVSFGRDGRRAVPRRVTRASQHVSHRPRLHRIHVDGTKSAEL